MAATPCLTQSCLSSPLILEEPKTRAFNISSFHCNFNPKPNPICNLSLSSKFNPNKKKTNGFSALFQNQEIATTATQSVEEDNEEEEEEEAGSESYNQPLPCQLYVCNLPSGCDISQLLDIFNPFGTVQSVEVSRDAETGLSRGCGYVTMSSISEAKAAIGALDGSDVGGRELRVTFAVDVNNGRRNIDALNSTPKRDLIFESPYKLYTGNLSWSVKPEELRNLFCQFGTVVSARVLQDRKGGKNRVYGFLSFSTAAELEAALTLNGTDYCGRRIILRPVVKQK